MSDQSVRFTIYSRVDCHLCAEMIAGLRELQGAASISIQVVDVDGAPELKARYGRRVPVLVAAGTELCEYRLDAAKVNEFLSKFS